MKKKAILDVFKTDGTSPMVLANSTIEFFAIGLRITFGNYTSYMVVPYHTIKDLCKWDTCYELNTHNGISVELAL